MCCDSCERAQCAVTRCGPPGRQAYFSVLLVVTDEVPQLLLTALQRGVQLLHLVHQVRLLRLQSLPVRLHRYGNTEGKGSAQSWDRVWTLRPPSSAQLRLRLRLRCNNKPRKSDISLKLRCDDQAKTISSAHHNPQVLFRRTKKKRNSRLMPSPSLSEINTFQGSSNEVMGPERFSHRGRISVDGVKK